MLPTIESPCHPPTSLVPVTQAGVNGAKRSSVRADGSGFYTCRVCGAVVKATWQQTEIEVC